MECNVIFMIGPQGSGKGTQAKMLADRLGLYSWDTGAILRESREHTFADGRTVGEIIDSGGLLADEQVLEVAKERLATIKPSQGVVFDGIPRRIGQAEFLMDFLKGQGRTTFCTIFLNVPREESIKRLLKRAEVQHREDDTLEAIEYRLDQYEEATVPVLDYLRERSTFIEIDGRPDIAEVTKEIVSALGLTTA
jgi:adenylate kinase